MRSVRMTICVMAAVLGMAAGQGFGVIEYKDGGTYDISSLIPDDVWVDYLAPGKGTTVNVLDGGGFITPWPHPPPYWGMLAGYNDSRINISGGYVDRLDAFNSTTVDLSGGNISRLNAWNSTTVNILPSALVNGPFVIRDNSSVAISGGFFAGNLTTLGNSSVVITGGNFRTNHSTYLIARSSSTVDITGGYVNMLRPNDTGRVGISGGRVGQLSAYGTSSTTFYGYDFTGTGSVHLIGDTVMGTGELHGKWLDGTQFTTNINIHDAGATILAIHGPAPVIAYAGGPYFMDIGDPPIMLGGSVDGAYSDAAWDLDLDGFFDDAFGLQPLISTAMLDSWGFSPGMTWDIGLQVTGLHGGLDVSMTELTYVPVPSALVLGTLGLSMAGWRLRRRRTS